jgi:hypothetical protein
MFSRDGMKSGRLKDAFLKDSLSGIQPNRDNLLRGRPTLSDANDSILAR